MKYIWINSGLFTETEMSPFWRNFHHWLHWKLSFWRLPVQPLMKISSKWWHFRFSVIDGPLRTNFSEIWIKNQQFSCQKMNLKMSPVQWRSYCSGFHLFNVNPHHYIDVIMTTMASQITSLMVVYSIVYSGADQRKHQSSAPLAFVRGIHRDRWIPHTKG